MRTTSLIIKNRSVILFGVSLALLLFLLKWIEYRFVIIDHVMEIYIGLIALIFTILGIWLARKLGGQKIKTVIVEKEITVPASGIFNRDQEAIEKAGLSPREVEVLELMASGLSNLEIAERLFVSLNTVKTHNSHVLSKLDVKRRTQAVEKARRLQMIQ